MAHPTFLSVGHTEAFIFTLSALSKRRDLLTTEETETAWNSVSELYKNHEELFDGKQALHVGLRRLTVKAWDSSQSDNVAAEPEFIRTLRLLYDLECGRFRQNMEVGSIQDGFEIGVSSVAALNLTIAAIDSREMMSEALVTARR